MKNREGMIDLGHTFATIAADPRELPDQRYYAAVALWSAHLGLCPLGVDCVTRCPEGDRLYRAILTARARWA